MSAQGEIGPALPSGLAVYWLAHDVMRLASQARELATPGPQADVPRARKLLEAAAALLAAAEPAGDD